MRNLRTATREEPPLATVREKPARQQNAAQPKINKYKKRVRDLADSVAGPVGRPLILQGIPWLLPLGLNTFQGHTGWLPSSGRQAASGWKESSSFWCLPPLPTAGLSRKFSLLPSAIIAKSKGGVDAFTLRAFTSPSELCCQRTLSSHFLGLVQLALMVPRTEFLTSYRFTKVNELILVLLELSNTDA